MKTEYLQRIRFTLFRFTLLLAMLQGFGSFGWGQTQTQTFPSSGTFTVPSGVTSITVEAWGGGGAGGQASSSSNGKGGGGGGAYASSILTVTPGNAYSVTVGAGGVAGTTSVSTSGGRSSFSTSVIALGGTYANNTNTSGTAGAGGSASGSTGTIKYSGGNGGNGNTASNGGGGGGGSSASDTGNGVDGYNASGGTGGAGGNGPDGDGGNGGNNNNSGSNGTLPGGGGGGRGDIGPVSGAGANGRVIVTWTPGYVAQFTAMNTGSPIWCAGETRTVTVTVKNIGQATWTNSAPDVNIGVKWNADLDYLIRTDANELAPGATQTYSLTVTAPSAGSNNLTFDVVKEGDCWFGNNNGSCGPGNAVYTSSAITISDTPAQPSAIAGSATPCAGSSQTYTVTNVPGVTYNWTFPAGWVQTAGGTTNSVTVTVGSVSGDIQVTSSIASCPGTVRSLAVTVYALSASVNGHTNITCFGANNGTITISASGGSAPYEYSVNNGVSYTAGSNPYTRTNLNANVPYKIRVKDSNGCESPIIP